MEILRGIVLPLILFSMPGVRESKCKLYMAATLVISGVMPNRFNMSLLALAMREGYSYFPHQMDIWVSATLVCWAVLFGSLSPIGCCP